MNKFKVVIVFSLLAGWYGCKSEKKDNKINNVFAFLENIKQEKFDSAYAMIAYNPFTSNANQTRIFDIKRTRKLILKYNLPSTEKWRLEYDTTGIVKIESFIIPIFHGYDSSSGLEEVYMRFSFDYTKQYIGDSIFNFNLHTRKR